MVERLADGIWRLELGVTPPLASSAYLVDEGGDGDDLTLIDAGLPRNRPSITRELERTGHAVADLDRLLLTHYDPDHVGGVSELSFDGPVYLGAEDVQVLTDEWTPPLFHHKGAFHRVVRRLLPLDRQPDRVRDGDRIGGFTAYHTPGHTPGHTVYVNESVDAAFLGDLVGVEDGELAPPFWLDTYDMHAVRESVRRLARRVPEFEYACLGHGTVLSDGYGRLQALADRL